MKMLDYIINKNDFNIRKWVESPLPEKLAPGEVLLKIEKFAFTANNISYANLGDSFGYWKLFPTEEGWGRIPAWGFADVAESNCEKIKVGERIYGFFPMSSHLIVAPKRIRDNNFMDMPDWRKRLPPLYNAYERVGWEECQYKDMEDEQMFFYPLFATSFLLYDMLLENNNYSAAHVLITSASSKTALGVAGLIHKDPGLDVRVIALTSPGNKNFCESAGYYDRVYTYDEIESLPVDLDATFLDFAGNPEIIKRVLARLGENVKYGTLIGLTHRGKTGENTEPAPFEVFFAPTRFKKRIGDWGAGEFQKKNYEAWLALSRDSKNWSELKKLKGQEEIERAFADALAGKLASNNLYSLSVI